MIPEDFITILDENAEWIHAYCLFTLENKLTKGKAPSVVFMTLKWLPLCSQSA